MNEMTVNDPECKLERGSPPYFQKDVSTAAGCIHRVLRSTSCWGSQMHRSTAIFGNGLGMALDPAYFQLEAALRFVWNGSDDFHPIHKRLVQSAMPDLSAADHPQTERQLDQLQMALLAARFLRGFETEEVRWLAHEAQQVPEAFARYIHEVAEYFHESGRVLPFVFTQALARFIGESASHIATLNYDNLLYDALANADVLSGYDGTLLDGFHRAGFANDNMQR